MKAPYLETIALLERLHRQCLECVKAELERLGIRDLNAVQGMLLLNIADSEVTVSELTQRGYYLGSNVSYNTTKMLENGYLAQRRSMSDRRVVYLRASEKGAEVARRLAELFDAHVETLNRDWVTPDGLVDVNATLKRIEAFWVTSRVRGL